jgi:hypothetical protein
MGNTGGPLPGGLWIFPTEGQIYSTVHFSAHACPANSTCPASSSSGIDHVNFTAWWPAMGNSPWFIACQVHTPSQYGVYNDVYQCDWDLSQVPPGSIVKVSFDVYDSTGNVNLAPNGVHTITKWDGKLH